jgi:hypothetical protein
VGSPRHEPSLEVACGADGAHVDAADERLEHAVAFHAGLHECTRESLPRIRRRAPLHRIEERRRGVCPEGLERAERRVRERVDRVEVLDAPNERGDGAGESELLREERRPAGGPSVRAGGRVALAVEDLGDDVGRTRAERARHAKRFLTQATARLREKRGEPCGGGWTGHEAASGGVCASLLQSERRRLTLRCGTRLRRARVEVAAPRPGRSRRGRRLHRPLDSPRVFDGEGLRRAAVYVAPRDERQHRNRAAERRPGRAIAF